MSFLMARTSLPPGFRFHPTDVELVMYYLKRKVMGKKIPFEAITELNIYKFSPHDLPDKSCLKSKDREWYFLCPTQRKYASGARMNRATDTGYWKTTGKDRPIIYNKNTVGMVKTLVFHQGSAPRGQRTDWVIHEYRIEDKNLANKGVAQDTYALCKVFHKNGPGPKNGAQYGAPFREEDWDSDEEIPVDSLLPNGPSSVAHVLRENENSSATMSMVDLENAPELCLNEPGPSFVGPSSNEVLLNGQNSFTVTSVVHPGNTSGWSLSKAGSSSAGHLAHDMVPEDDILHLLEDFLADSPLPLTELGNNELGDLDQGRATAAIPHLDGSDPFDGLEDLSNLAEHNGGGLNYFDAPENGCTANNMLLQNDSAFLELNDLDTPLHFTAEPSGTEQIQTGGLYRPCSSSGSEQMLTGRLYSPYNTNNDLRQLWYIGNFPGNDPHLTDSHQLSVFSDSSDRQRNSTNVSQTGNAYDSANAAYNLDFTSYRQQEEIRNTPGNQERGVQKRILLFSRLQLLLESNPADPASAAYDGSSIHVKAEVTYRFTTCTKDALSVMVGESTFVYSYWWSLPGLGFQKTLEYCCTGSAIVFYLRLGSAFMCILMIALLIQVCRCLWYWFCFCDIIGCFERILDCVLINLSSSICTELKAWIDLLSVIFTSNIDARLSFLFNVLTPLTLLLVFLWFRDFPVALKSS